MLLIPRYSQEYPDTHLETEDFCRYCQNSFTLELNYYPGYIVDKIKQILDSVNYNKSVPKDDNS
jgi:hypothetical protein